MSLLRVPSGMIVRQNIAVSRLIRVKVAPVKFASARFVAFMNERSRTRVGEVGAREIGAVQGRAGKVSAGQVGAGEVRRTKVGVGEVCLDQSRR